MASYLPNGAKFVDDWKTGGPFAWCFRRVAKAGGKRVAAAIVRQTAGYVQSLRFQDIKTS
jgi:hypothetical protein